VGVLLSPASLARQAEALSAGQFLTDPLDLIETGLSLLKPPERISTLECAETYRLLPGIEDGAVVRYSRKLTPYNVGAMDSLDNPACKLVVMVKPSRSGGTAVVENYEFKMMRFGPMGHIAHVLNSDEAVTDYCRTVVKPMFEHNPELQARVGAARGEDTDSYKRIAGYPVEWLSAKNSTFRNREPIFMAMDEVDAWAKTYARSPKVQLDGRQKRLGHRRKGAILSHPDLGWKAGVAACFEDSSRGIYVMRCAECQGFAAAYATKFWDRVAEFKLYWPRDTEAHADTRLDRAEREAGMLCPHCGVVLSEDQRRSMVEAALDDPKCGIKGWMHRGQTLDALEGVLGEMTPHETHGFWTHGLMVKAEKLGKLAREYEAALLKFERTRDPDQLKEFLSKQLCEVFEGAATTGGVSARGLKARAEESELERGIVPPEVRFITAAVDTGGRKFDVAWLGWDLEGRSWLLDRLTIRQRVDDDGVARDIHTGGSVEDWMVLLGQVLDRTFPLQGRPDLALPVAVMCVDSGDGNVTEKARAFARRAELAGYKWGSWSRVKLIKGVAGKRPALPDAPRKIDKDEAGKPVEPVIYEWSLGVDKLKELTLERLAVTDDAPGQVRFCAGLESRYIDEYFGESLVDGKWQRSGPNEMLDLHGYAEAGRLMLKPDRKDIAWDDAQRLPPWARPIALEPEGGDRIPPAGGAPQDAGAPKAKTIFERFEGLNKGN
jgi:phage terminase large subunit GpA-like protein